LNGFTSFPWISLMIIFFIFGTIQHLPLEILFWHFLTFKFSPINNIQTILIKDQPLHVSFHSLKHLYLRCNTPIYTRSSVLCCLLSLPCSEAPSDQEENQARNNKSACCSCSHCCSYLTV